MNNNVNAQSTNTGLYRILVIIGGGAMLVAMTVELLAVAGRQTGWPLPGSIELVQVLVTMAGSAALVVATIHGSHARVKLVIDRLPAGIGLLVGRLNAVCSAVFFLMLLVGSAWIALDLWQGHEESEIWLVPYKPLRLVVIATCLAVGLMFLRDLRKRGSS